MRKLNSRTIHRYLSVVIGVQLLFWTISGLIFAWNPIGKVRGEHLTRKPQSVDLSQFELKSVNELVANLDTEKESSNKLLGATLRMLLADPVYEFEFLEDEGRRVSLCHAETGELISPISEDLARRVALDDFAEATQITSIELIEDGLSSHSEYRGKELPAWRVALDHSSGTVIYVSANRGTVTTRRNSRWRVFDFFWMLHTMDYQGRDNFNTILLKSVSIFGVATVLSGYWLWWRTSRLRRRRLGRSKNSHRPLENA
jgi:hypothetical protein|tara:strand:+ start:4040 stop:4813 length:774 start_codon:yes stop_codon:yes gene_type:complete